jgi:cellulose synthase/poly-beta-1,6-N-acetylglucosamine synthase-like glycosyltransferase
VVALEVVFWASVGLIAYTVVGYPLIALVLRSVARKVVDKRPITPSVSFIIAAYNEEEALADKLRETLKLDYPRELLEVIVASDGSTDGTDEIARSFADQGVILYRAPERQGKSATLNQAVERARGEILVFSDATGRYNGHAIRELVANFNDSRVGCVTGQVAYEYGIDTTSVGFKSYQRIVVAVRRAESQFGSQTSVSGSIHAMRRELYRPVRSDFSHDVIDPVHTVAQGYRVIYEANAVSLEESRTEPLAEFRSRARIGVRGMTSLRYVLGELGRNGRWGFLFQVLSHKVLRWWLWVPLALALVTSLALATESGPFAALALVQLGLYGLALAGLSSDRWRVRVPGLSGLSFFLLGNAAMAVAMFRWLFGQSLRTWEPIR